MKMNTILSFCVFLFLNSFAFAQTINYKIVGSISFNKEGVSRLFVSDSPQASIMLHCHWGGALYVFISPGKSFSYGSVAPRTYGAGNNCEGVIATLETATANNPLWISLSPQGFNILNN